MRRGRVAAEYGHPHWPGIGQRRGTVDEAPDRYGEARAQHQCAGPRPLTSATMAMAKKKVRWTRHLRQVALRSAGESDQRRKGGNHPSAAVAASSIMLWIERLARRDVQDQLDEPVRIHRFREVPVETRRHGLSLSFSVPSPSRDEHGRGSSADARSRRASSYRPCRHPDIEQRDLRPDLLREDDGLGPSP